MDVLLCLQSQNWSVVWQYLTGQQYLFQVLKNISVTDAPYIWIVYKIKIKHLKLKTLKFKLRVFWKDWQLIGIQYYTFYLNFIIWRIPQSFTMYVHTIMCFRIVFLIFIVIMLRHWLMFMFFSCCEYINLFFLYNCISLLMLSVKNYW